MMKEITSDNGQIIFGLPLTRDILGLPANTSLDDVPDNFLVDTAAQKKTYKGNLKVVVRLDGQTIQDNKTIYYHICFPSHVEMSEQQYESWTERFPNHSQDERIIFVPETQEGE